MAIHSRRSVPVRGRTLALNDDVFASATETNFRNRGAAYLLQDYNRIYCDPLQATELYTPSAR